MLPEPSILYYVHNDGSGHLERARNLCRHLSCKVIFVTKTNNLKIKFPDNVIVAVLPEVTTNASKDLNYDCLHNSIMRQRDLRRHTKEIFRLIDHYNCKLGIVDVSVEIAMMLRLYGVPYIYMRQHGYRNDPAHLQAYKAASLLIGTYPKELEDEHVEEWILDKTKYYGGFYNVSNKHSKLRTSEKPSVLIMRGKGLSSITNVNVKCAAEALSNYYWKAIGFDDDETGSNYQILKRVNNPDVYLASADIVIANTGNNTVQEIGAYQKPFITWPEDRYFQEQCHKAKILERENLAIVIYKWPDSRIEWNNVFTKAKKLHIEKWSNILNENNVQDIARDISNYFKNL